jgi:hypothetical protein
VISFDASGVRSPDHPREGLCFERSRKRAELRLQRKGGELDRKRYLDRSHGGLP